MISGFFLDNRGARNGWVQKETISAENTIIQSKRGKLA
jgi:hypothetical protein